MPSFWTRRRACGLPTSTRPATSPSQAEYDSAWFVRCAIDAGTSRHTAAVFFQVRTNPSDRAAARDRLRRIPRAGRRQPEKRPGHQEAG